jgi:hypothetical protein
MIPVITRSCIPPTKRERYADWCRKHPEPESIFARRIFLPKPEVEDGTQDSNEK